MIARSSWLRKTIYNFARDALSGHKLGLPQPVLSKPLPRVLHVIKVNMVHVRLHNRNRINPISDVLFFPVYDDSYM